MTGWERILVFTAFGAFAGAVYGAIFWWRKRRRERRLIKRRLGKDGPAPESDGK